MRLPIRLNVGNDVYYNYKKACSTNASMVICIGGRGIGKTTAWLIKALKECEDGYEFVYLRRYKSELKAFVRKDELGMVCEGIQCFGDGNGGYEFRFEGKTLGHGIALSTSQAYKSAGFPKVRTLIYDEATLKPRSSIRYLSDEMTSFLEFQSTVFRTRKKVRTVVLGNNMDLFNPYFSYFDVPLFEGSWHDRKRGIYCEMPKNNPKLLEIEKETPLYRMTEGTAYWKYHYENEVLDVRNYPVAKERPKNLRPVGNLVLNSDTLRMFLHDREGGAHLYVERVHRRMKRDGLTLEILNSGNVNYADARIYKRKYARFAETYWFSDSISFSDEKAGAMLWWVIDNLK